MKKLNRKFIKGTNWVLAGLLSFLGFSSCDRFGRDEYGSPYAEFVVSGKVTDTDGKGLQGIKVDVPYVERVWAAKEYRDTLFTWNYMNTLQTNKNGDFVYTYRESPSDTVKVKMKFEDLANQIFETDSTTTTFVESELKDGKGWCIGKAEKKISIELKKK